MRGRPALALAACVAAIGLWQIGAGLYIPAKALVAQVMLNDAWRRTIGGVTRAKPWPWADTWPVARLRVPKHGIDQIVLKRLDQYRFALLQAMLPVSATVIGFVALDQTPQWAEVGGILLVVTALLVRGRSSTR